jgi:peptide/nickel transport system ATP-binding protein
VPAVLADPLAAPLVPEADGLVEAPPSTQAAMPLLRVRDLGVEFARSAGPPLSVLRHVDLVLESGRTLAVVGESGSGKSTLAACLNGLLAANGRVSQGEILFGGRDLTRLDGKSMRAVRGADIGLVPQNPMTNLNPLQRVGTQIREALEIHGLAKGRDAERQTVELIAMVGLPEPARRARQYPHELSGGMRQRVLIAMGLACRPRLLIADEPTSALDVTVQRVILDELARLTRQFGTALMLITHDLSMAAERADDVLVLFRGEVVETGPAEVVLHAPRHAYTKRLIGAAPSLTSRPLVTGWQPIAEGPGRPARPLVELVNVRKTYGGGRTLFGARAPFVAVAGSSLTIGRGQTVAIVGESGSGKSTTARLLLKIEQPTAGDIVFDGKEVTRLEGKDLLAFRRRVQPVFQNATGSLDARYTVRQSIEEPLILHGMGTSMERRRRVDALLDQVALPRELAARRPAEISGGQAQRVAIARALALSPDLIVLDEAVSALDVVVQMQILELLARLQAEMGLAYLFISHDLAVVRLMAHEVHVMQAGVIVESGPPEVMFAHPAHPYTRQLVAALPRAPGATPGGVRTGAGP